MSEKTSQIEHKADESSPLVSIDDAGPIDLSRMPVAGPSHVPDAELLQQPVGDATNEESVARVFELDIDCFEELFEYLSLKDLFVLRQTCKRFKRLVDYYIKEYYPAIKLNYLKISLDYDTNIEQFRSLDSNLIKSIKAIYLDDMRIKYAKTIKDILNYVEVVKVQSGEHDLHEELLKFCPKIKCLKINVCCPVDEASTSWLEQQYPTLEHIAFDDYNHDGHYNGFEIPQLRTFFTINPNIRCFSTSLSLLCENRYWLLGSDINLDLLEVERFGVDDDDFYENGFTLIGNLYAQGFYQRLHYYATEVDDDHMSLINSVPGLEKLFLVNDSDDSVAIDLVVPPSLKELCFGSSNDINNPEVMANNLLNVERLSIGRTNVDGILPYVRLSPRLKQIRVERFADGTRLMDGIIDLVKLLNQERQELRGAKKLRFYLNEEIFLKLKWSGFATKRSLIELKRHEEFPRQPYSAFHSCYYNYGIN